VSFCWSFSRLIDVVGFTCATTWRPSYQRMLAKIQLLEKWSGRSPSYALDPERPSNNPRDRPSRVHVPAPYFLLDWR
jgi:hypothetical protein